MIGSALPKLALALAMGAAFAPAALAQDGQKPDAQKQQGDQPTPDKPKTDAPPPRPQDGGGPRFGGGMARMLDGAKDALNLTDDQMAKLRDITGDMGETMRKAWEESGGDMQKMRDKMQETRDKMMEKVKTILTKEQSQKLDDLMAQGGRGGFGGMGMGGPGGGYMRRFDPNSEEARKALADKAENALVLMTEEKAAVMPLLRKLLDLKAEIAQGENKRRDELSRLAKNAKDGDKKAEGQTGSQTELEAKLSEHKKAVVSDKKKLDDAQTALRDCLTVDNEARLVALGILD